MIRVGFALLFLSIQQLASAAQQTAAPAPWTMEAAAQLAARILSLLPRRPSVAIEFQNLSTVTAADSSSFRSALEDELRKAGVEMEVTAPPESRLRITISQNLRGLLLVAEAGAGENRQIAMLPWPAPPAIEQKPRMKIVVKPVWEQPERILDIALVDSGAGLLVLSATKVTQYRLTDGKWISAGSAVIALLRPMPRDPRGRIVASAPNFRLEIPGTSCEGTMAGTMQLNCLAGNKPWLDSSGLQMQWSADRNVLTADGVKAAFFTAAPGLIDGTSELPPGGESWGSDIAGIQSGCDPGATLLAVGGGDNPPVDSVQAFHVANGQATAASEPLTVPGPISALWSGENRSQATLVFRNSKTGNYEASRLGVSCAE